MTLDNKADIPGKVQLYLFRLQIGEDFFGGEIPAKSWGDAQDKVGTFGAIIDGISMEQRPMGLICSICTGDMTIDTRQS